MVNFGSMIVYSFIFFCILAAISLVCQIIFHPIKSIKTTLMILFGGVGLYFVYAYLSYMQLI